MSHRLPDDFPADEGIRIRHEIIYRELYLQGRGALREGLTEALRTGRRGRKPAITRQSAGRIVSYAAGFRL